MVEGDDDFVALFALVAEDRDEFVELFELPAPELTVGQKTVPKTGFGVHRVQGNQSHVVVGVGNVRVGDSAFDAEQVLLEELESLLLGVSTVPAVIVIARQWCHLETGPVQRPQDPAGLDELYLGSVIDHIAGDQDQRLIVIATPFPNRLANNLLGLLPPVNVGFFADVEIADVQNPHSLSSTVSAPLQYRTRSPY